MNLNLMKMEANGTLTIVKQIPLKAQSVVLKISPDGTKLAILKNKSEIELYGIKEETIETELLESIDNNSSLFYK